MSHLIALIREHKVLHLTSKQTRATTPANAACGQIFAILTDRADYSEFPLQ